MDLTLSVTSPLPPEPLLLRVDLEGGERVFVEIEGGWFQGPVPARPLHVVGVTDVDGASPPLRSSAPRPASFEGERTTIDFAGLFGGGVPVPADGVLRLHLLWLAPCDGATLSPTEGSRFGSAEHALCALLVGKQADRKTRLEHHGIRAHFSGETPLDVGGKPLDFGMIIALAGDFYAHLDDRAAREFAWAWPAMESLTGWLSGDYRKTTLAGDSPDQVEALDHHIHSEAAGIQLGAVAEAIEKIKLRFPMRRYLALASQNHCHFACQPGTYSEQGNHALTLYRAYHTRAREDARAAGQVDDRTGLESALAVDAFGCHFLTDLFASGHIRTPRLVLGERFGISRGALVMSKRMHDEDNQEGLWVTPFHRGDGPRVVWRAYGDDSLFRPEATAHFAQVQEAVRRSAAEVFAAYCEGKTGKAISLAALAEHLIPVPLPPGQGPDPESDVSPDGQSFAPHPPNHPPLYKVLEDGRVAERSGAGYKALGKTGEPVPARPPGPVVA